jgi:hypothetical protein
MSSTARSFLNKLKDINESNTVNVKVPSTGEKVDFRLISVSQQKALLRTAFDGVDGVIDRAVITNKIIKDNSTIEDEFLIVDKPAIFIALRKESLGSKIKIKDEEYDLDNVTPLDKADVKLKHTIVFDDIKVNLKVPTLTIDSEVAAKLAKEIAKVQGTDDKIKQGIDTVISHESCKYIDKVSVGEDVIEFATISVHERVDIVNNLPLSLNNEIVTYIGSIKTATDKALTVAEEVVVEIDASFLSGD